MNSAVVFPELPSAFATVWTILALLLGLEFCVYWYHASRGSRGRRRAVLLGLMLVGIGGGWQPVARELLQRERNWLTDFGAIAGDGKADDAAWADLRAHLIATKQYTAYIPVGDFEFEDPIVLADGMRLKGDGWNSKLIYEGTGQFISYNDEVIISDVAVLGDSGGIVAGSILIGPGSTDPSDYDRTVTIRNVLVRYGEDGIRSNWQGGLTIIDPYIRGCTNGLRITGRETNSLNVTGGEIRECDNAILDDSTTGNVQSYTGALIIEGNHQYGYRKTANGSTVVVFDTVYFEDNDDVSGTGADISIGSSGFANNLAIRNARFNNTYTAIDLGACVVGEIANCNFFNDTNTILLGANTRYVRVDPLTNTYHSTSGRFDPATDNAGQLNEVGQHPAVFGVRGNGTTDDTAGLLLWLAANPTYAMLPKPSASYLVTGSLTLLDGQTLEGEGWNSTIIKAGPAQTDPVIVLGSDSRLRHLEVLGQSVAGSAGIKPGSNKVRWLVDDVYWTLFADGFVVDSTATAGAIRNSRGFNCTATGLLVSANAPGLLVDNCSLTGSPLNVSITGAVQGMKVTNSRIASAATHGLQVTGGTLGLALIGNLFDSNTGADIDLAAVSQLATLIEANRCVTTPTSVQIALADKTVLRSNSLGGTTAPISITNVGAQRTEIGANDWTVVAFNYGTMNSGFATSYLGRIYSSGTPDGTGPWETGETVWHSAPASGITPMGWVCTTGHASAATFVALPTIP
jgi:hypothetical protein